MSKTNCINCGAAKDTAEIRCPFCGTTYLDLTAIDFSSDAPVVCQFVLPETYQIQGIEGKLVMSMMAIPKLEEMREETEDIVCHGPGPGSRRFRFTASRSMELGISFTPVANKDDVLFTLRPERMIE